MRAFFLFWQVLQEMFPSGNLLNIFGNLGNPQVWDTAWDVHQHCGVELMHVADAEWTHCIVHSQKELPHPHHVMFCLLMSFMDSPISFVSAGAVWLAEAWRGGSIDRHSSATTTTEARVVASGWRERKAWLDGDILVHPWGRSSGRHLWPTWSTHPTTFSTTWNAQATREVCITTLSIEAIYYWSHLLVFCNTN